MICIRSSGIVSPQGPTGHPPVTHEGNRLKAVEPDYGTLIDPKLIRRMSRIIRMGVAAAMDCLGKAGAKAPDAIVTGTAYGCLEDTNVFLQRMVENQEEMLTPTAFIQSTHNTVGAQIALMLQCHGYNNTFVHRGFSFESALLDAVMLLKEGKATTVLAGGVDEITDTSHAILSRFGLYKNNIADNFKLFTTPGRGTINGEGAAFFLLSNEGPGMHLEAMETFYKPASVVESIGHIQGFLERNNYGPIDLVLTGKNGNPAEDKLYEKIESTVFKGYVIEHFKHLSGEYPTAGAFALWLALSRLAASDMARAFQPGVTGAPRRVLIYNSYQDIHHSLYLVSC